MNHFELRGGELHCEDVPLTAIAQAVGTPVYVYSRARIEANYHRIALAFAPLQVGVHYAVKANGNLAVLRLLNELGAGFDVVSGGELFRARRAAGASSRENGAALLSGAAGSNDLPRGKRVIGVIQGDAVPQVFIPRLIRMHRAGRFPFDRLVRFYPFAEINRAIADARRGAVVKPVLTWE